MKALGPVVLTAHIGVLISLDQELAVLTELVAHELLQLLCQVIVRLADEIVLRSSLDPVLLVVAVGPHQKPLHHLEDEGGALQFEQDSVFPRLSARWASRRKTACRCCRRRCTVNA